jgi:hypothetical protein
MKKISEKIEKKKESWKRFSFQFSTTNEKNLKSFFKSSQGAFKKLLSKSNF